MKRKYLATAIFLMVFLCIGCSGPYAGTESGSKSSNQTGVESTADPDAVEAEPNNQNSETKTETEEIAMEMRQEDIARLIENELNEEYVSFTGETEGVVEGSISFIKLRINPGREEDAVRWIENFAGQGRDAGTRSLPAFDNQICRELQAMEPLRVYDYLRPGKGGALTTSSEIYTARERDRMYVFLFGL